MYKVGEKYLLTLCDWVYAPDGQCYAAIFGTLHEIADERKTLGMGFQTDMDGSRPYMRIGDMVIGVDSVISAINTPVCEFVEFQREDMHEGDWYTYNVGCRIYDADGPPVELGNGRAEVKF